MRTASYERFGEPAEVLVLSEQPVPEPGPGQVRIKTLLSPIHNHDISTLRGQYGYKPELPAIGGTEAVGLVDALGDGVTGIKPGLRVAVSSVHGTWAEYFLAPASGLVPVPDAISDEAASQLIAMPFSALTLLEFLEVKTGDWIIQNTANGTVGKTLAMLGKARGVKVINLVRREAGVAELAELGIAHGVSTDQPDWKKRVRALVGDASIRAAVDSIGGRAAGDLLSVLGDGGLLVSFGAMGREPMQLDSGNLIFKQAVVKGFWASKVASALPGNVRRELFSELLRLVASGELALPVEAIFDVAEAGAAAEASLQPGRKGKTLIRP